MNIPTIYLLFGAEFLIIIIVLTGFIYFYKRKKKNSEVDEDLIEDDNAVDLGNTYIDYIDQELTRQNNLNIDQSGSDDPEQNESNNNKLKLLTIRNMFLNIEKSASENSENEHAYWDTIFSGIQNISNELTIIEEVEVDSSQLVGEIDKSTDKEKVLYIETQGKKIDGEVDKLKDIISEQELTLNDMKKALLNSDEGENTEDSPELQALRSQIETFERQIGESKMCMEVMEMENDRLQAEVNNLQSRYNDLFREQQEVDSQIQAENSENIDQMKNAIDKQEQQISALNGTIGKLELSAQESEELKAKIDEITRNNQEMTGCIAVLEDENEFLSNMVNELQQKIPDSDAESTEASQEEIEQLKQKISDLNHTVKELEQSSAEAGASSANDEQVKILKSKIKSYEQDMIKKDVAYAKLQDELSTIEKEYQAIYEQMHGDG